MSNDKPHNTELLEQEPYEHQIGYFTGRREMSNPDTMDGTATEFEPGIIHVRLGDRSNDAYWLEFTLSLRSTEDRANEEEIELPF